MKWDAGDPTGHRILVPEAGPASATSGEEIQELAALIG
jgi:hypothetical protein